MVNNFTNDDDENLAIYIATNDPREVDGRKRKDLYKQLVENPDQWPWSVRHTWMSWWTRYTNDHEGFDRRIHALQKENHSDGVSQRPSAQKLRRTKFTAKEDRKLVRFLGKMSSKEPNARYGRSGNVVYQNVLVANPHKYPWAISHTWQSWRNRYVKRNQHFDKLISQWQENHGVDPDLYKRTLGYTEKSPDLQPDQTDEQLRALTKGQHKAEHGTKRRRLEEEDIITDTAPDGLPLPKRQKTSPISDGDGAKEPTEIAQQSGSISPIGIENGIKSGEGRDSDQPVAVTGPQELGACDVGEDKRCDQRSSHRPDHSEGQHEPIHMDVCSLAVHINTNNPSESQHVQVSPNKPTHPQKLNRKSLAKDDTSGDVHTSNTTPKDFQVSTNRSTGLSPPPESSPTRIPGDSFDTSGDAIEVPTVSRHSTSRPMTVGRSHHPTPPSTNVQSERSLPSPSTGSDSSMLTAKAKSCHSPSVLSMNQGVGACPSPAASTATYPELLVETRLAPAKPPLFASPTFSDPFLGSSPLPQRTADLQELATKSLPYSSGGAVRGRTPGKEDDAYESGSDGPFASCPSSPQRIDVIHGLPKFHSGMTFRGNHWFRERNVVSGNNIQKGLKRDVTSRKRNDDEDARNHKTVPGKLQEAQVEKRRSNQARDVVSGNSSTRGSAPSDIVDLHFNRSTASSNSKYINSSQETAIAIGPTPIPANHVPHLIGSSEVDDVPGDTSSRSHHLKEDHMAAARKVTDVFSTLTPVASGTAHNPYVLNTAHLPEPSSTSSVIRVQLDSPVPGHYVPRDKGRRRTFAGFKSRSSLPNIDLVKKLGERASSRTTTQFRTRQTSLDNASNSDSIASIARTPERMVSRYRPPRSSVIPVLVDPKLPHPPSAVLTRWSPSTHNHIIKAGLGAIFKRMEENHGFSTSVVQRAWLQQNTDLDATDRMLLRMRIAAENASHGDDYAEQQHGFASNEALEGTQNKAPSHECMAPDSGTTSDEYTPPARSRAEQYRKLLERGQLREARQREINLATHGSSKSSARKKVLPPAVWGAKDDEALRSGDKAKLETLADQFGEDIVRCRFLVIMRESIS